MLLDDIQYLISTIDTDADLTSSPDTVVNKILALGKWEEIRDCLFEILLSQDQSLWNDVIVCLYYFQNRNFAFDEIKTIGILCHCQTLCETLDDNLIWTIIIQLKSLPYLSDYDPFQDPQIKNEMKQINIITTENSKLKNRNENDIEK